MALKKRVGPVMGPTRGFKGRKADMRQSSPSARNAFCALAERPALATVFRFSSL